MNGNAYVQLWKLLLNGTEYAGLSIEAVVCYCVLADRYRLSEIKEYCDSQGRLCVVYPQEALGVVLRCNRKKVAKVLCELEDYGLIHRRHQGMNKADAIYVYALRVSTLGTTGCADEGHCDVSVEDNSNTDNSNIVIIKDIDQGKVRVALIRVWDYDYVVGLSEGIVDIVDMIIDVAVGILCSPATHLRIAGKNRCIEDIYMAITKLTSIHILFIAQRIKENQHQISNMESYIATALYNSGIQVPG